MCDAKPSDNAYILRKIRSFADAGSRYADARRRMTPRLFLIELRHRHDRFEYYECAENAAAALAAFGGPIAVLAEQRGLLRCYPVTAEPGGTVAMTRTEVLDAIEARISARRAEAGTAAAE
jgi:hypothetical protein